MDTDLRQLLVMTFKWISSAVQLDTPLWAVIMPLVTERSNNQAYFCHCPVRRLQALLPAGAAPNALN